MLNQSHPAAPTGTSSTIAADSLTWQKLIWAVRDAYGALVCWSKGRCEFNTYVFHTNCLYFCARCNKEMHGRTFDDLLPMDDEQRKQMEWLDPYYGEPA